MHVRSKVVGHIEGDDLSPGPLGEVVELAGCDIVLVDEDKVIAVRTGLLVPEPDGMADFVGNCAVLKDTRNYLP